MFSSLSKYSPKQLLANYLSQSLAEYFDVDPTRVETNLIQDAKALLNDIKIKERRLGGSVDSYLKVGGSISQIEFSWVWDSSALIKDVRLTVRGFAVNVSVIRDGGEKDSMLSDAIPEVTSNNMGSSGGAVKDTAPSDWKAKYMQQIIDHLTLAVTDINISIELNEESKVELLAKDMELITMPNVSGREDATSDLVQNISLASIEAWMKRDGAKVPILEPFGYQATVTRMSGRRFDGILSGLFVEGRTHHNDSSCASSTIRVHAGIQQIEGLNSLQQVLLLVGDEDSAGIKSGVNEPSDGVLPDIKAYTTESKSIFHLPFQSMEVVLENNTNLRLAGCNVRYCADGSELSVDCCRGIWVDEAPLSKDSRWVLDLVSSQLVLESLPSEENVEGDFFYTAHSDGGELVQEETENKSGDAMPFRMDLSLSMFEKIYRGIQAIMPQCTEAQALAEQTMNQYAQPSKPSSTSLPWSVKSTRPVAFRFTGSSDSWVEVLANSPKLSQGAPTAKAAFSFECMPIEIKSNAGFDVHVPQVSTKDDGCIVVEHRITVNVDSIDALNELGSMWKQITDIMGDDSSSSGVPVPISLAGIDITLKEPQVSTVKMSHISGFRADWSIGVLQVHDVGGVSLDASSLRVSLDPDKKTLYVQKIGQLSYNNVDYLTSPIDGTTLIVKNNDTVLVACKSVAIQCPNQATTPQEDCSGSGEGSFSFPLSINITMDHFRLESSTRGNINVDGVNFWMRPTEKLLMLNLNLNSVKANIIDTLEFSCGKVGSSIQVDAASSDANSSALTGFGYQLSSGSVTIHDITKVSTSAGHLNKPLDVIEISLRPPSLEGSKNQTVVVKCNKILFCNNADDFFASQADSPKASSPKKDAADITSFKLPVSVYFGASRFVMMKNFGSGNPGLCFDGISIHLTPSQTGVLVNAQFNQVQGRGENQADFTIKGAKLSMRTDTTKGGKPEFFGLAGANLTVNEVSSLVIPGKMKLAAPIRNSLLDFKSNSVYVKCDSLHALYYTQSGDEVKISEKVQTAGAFAEIPAFTIMINEVIIDSPTENVLVCKQFSTQYMKASNTALKSLQVGVSSLNGNVGTDSCNMNGIFILTKWQEATGSESKISIPYLGSLSFAQVELESCAEMRTSSFSLIVPVLKPKFMYKEGCFMLEMSEIQLDLDKASAVSSYPNHDEQSQKWDLSSIRVPIGINVSDKLRLRTETFDVQFENLGIDYVHSSSSLHDEMFIHCDRLVESTMVSAGNIDLHLNLSLADLQKEIGNSDNVLAVMDCVKKASVKIDEVTKFVMDGRGRLSQPLQKVHGSYQDGTFASDIDAIQFECTSLDKSLVLGLRKLNVKIITDVDPFDHSIRLVAQSDAIFGKGDVNFDAAGVSLTTEIVPTSNNGDALSSKALPIPSLGYVSMAVLDASEVTSLRIQETGSLKSPTKLAVRFENNIISLDCPTLFLQRSVPKKVSRTKLEQASQPIELPCKASISIGAFQVFEPSQDNIGLQREVRCSSLSLMMEPLKVGVGQQNESIRGPGIGIQVIVNDFKSLEGSTILDSPRLSVSGILQVNDLATVGNLAVGIERAKLTAAFSMADWSASLENEPSAVIRLPFASIPKFELTLQAYAGAIANISDATIACDEFEGSANTTLDQIGKHYINIVKRRIPYLVLAKTDLCGANVGDSVGVMAGTVLTHTNVVGATVGVVSRDVVGSALTMGKASRGASASDKYKFGDFSRGVLSSVKHAAKTGSEIRGGDSYVPGDLTSGAAVAAGNYATENRCRLAGVGGSAAGMVAGAALLGPVGFVAGSMLGGSAAKSSMAALTGDPKKDKQIIENRQSSASSSGSTPTTQKQYSAQIPDLLSDDTPDYNLQGQQPIPPPAQAFHQNTQHLAHRSKNQANSYTSPPAQAFHQKTQHQASCSYNQANSYKSSAAQSRTPNPNLVHRSHNQTGSYPTSATAQSRAALQHQVHPSHNQGSRRVTPTSVHHTGHARSEEQGYQFGDITRGIVAKGKKADGRDDNSGYKFGDFTRGLFK